MKIFTNDDIRAIDRYTIDEEGVSSRELIKRVADGVTTEIMGRWRPSKPVVVFAGPGNNGADALAVARQLGEAGYKVDVLLFNINGNSLSRDCRLCRDDLADVPGVHLTEIVNSMKIIDITRNHLVIDGLFGSGLRGSLEGGFKSLVRFINEAHATVVSIDVPSGLSADWNPLSVNRDIVHANLTIAIQFPRISFLMADNEELVGEWKVIDIGLSRKAINATETKFHYITEYDINRLLRPRQEFSSKADFGSALLIAGSYGMMGAAVMACRGALRSGAGKVTVHAPKCGNMVLQTSVPECMFEADRNDLAFTEWTPRFQPDAIGMGPGLGTQEATVKAVETIVKTWKKPLVIDADALNCIARRPALLNSLPRMSIITPHAGEFDRLFGEQPTAESRLLKAVEMARQYNIIIVLKGRYTATVRPDGRVYFNSTGCPAMATPGSGDVLTGIITSLAAQGYHPELAALIGVFVHGFAGQVAAEDHGAYGVTAGDIADNTGRAIKELMD